MATLEWLLMQLEVGIDLGERWLFRFFWEVEGYEEEVLYFIGVMSSFDEFLAGYIEREHLEENDSE